MKREEILKKAIEKAINNDLPTHNDDGDIYLSSIKDHSFMSEGSWFANKEAIIFDHDFAKAFFGEEDYCKLHSFQGEDWEHQSCSDCNQGWAYRLKEMVLQEDPIKYLEQFISSPTE